MRHPATTERSIDLFFLDCDCYELDSRRDQRLRQQGLQHRTLTSSPSKQISSFRRRYIRPSPLLPAGTVNAQCVSPCSVLLTSDCRFTINKYPSISLYFLPKPTCNVSSSEQVTGVCRGGRHIYLYTCNIYSKRRDYYFEPVAGQRVE